MNKNHFIFGYMGNKRKETYTILDKVNINNYYMFEYDKLYQPSKKSTTHYMILNTKKNNKLNLK